MSEEERGVVVELDGYFGTFWDVARIARTSTDTEPDQDRDEKLVRYLYRNRHTSPFEFVVTRWVIEAPIFVARQWMRHRTWSYSERSGRYTKFQDEMWRPTVWRRQAEKNRQSSHGLVEDQVECDGVYDAAIDTAEAAYDQLIKQGVAREQARAALPQGAMTRFFAQVDMHNLLHFFELRDDSHAQQEIADYARGMKQIMLGVPDLAPFVRLIDGVGNER